MNDDFKKVLILIICNVAAFFLGQINSSYSSDFDRIRRRKYDVLLCLP